MPFVPAPNIVQVEVRATNEGQKIENRFNVDMLAAPTVAAMTDLANGVKDWITGWYALQLPFTVAFTEIVCTDLSTQNGAQVSISAGGVVGDKGGTALPNEVSICISLRTGNRGRSARGRAYVLAIPTSQTDTINTISPTYGAALVAVFNNLIAEITSLGFALVIVSYRANKVPRPGGPVFFVVTTALLVDRVVDSQRRRKPGVGS